MLSADVMHLHAWGAVADLTRWMVQHVDVPHGPVFGVLGSAFLADSADGRTFHPPISMGLKFVLEHSISGHKTKHFPVRFM